MSGDGGKTDLKKHRAKDKKGGQLMIDEKDRRPTDEEKGGQESTMTEESV